MINTHCTSTFWATTIYILEEIIVLLNVLFTLYSPGGAQSLLTFIN